MLATVHQHAERARRQARREAEPWPAPRLLSATLAQVCPFDPQVLPETLRPWVLDVAERLQVPADYPAVAAIVMLAGALGRRASIRPLQHDHWVVFPNLWGAIVGRSGIMKSPVLRAVMGPLRRRQSLAMTVYESEKDAYQRQLQQYAAQKRNRSLTTIYLRRSLRTLCLRTCRRGRFERAVTPRMTTSLCSLLTSELRAETDARAIEAIALIRKG